MIADLVRQTSLADIYDKVKVGTRLSYEEGLRLYESSDLHTLGFMANIVRERINGDKTYFVRNQHINYTNICNKFCKFCAFYALPGQERAYSMTPEEIQKKVLEQIEQPITEIHMVAGINPRLPYSYYLDILRAVKAVRPDVHIKAYTMVEIEQMHKLAKKPLAEVYADLKAAGLDSLPGGGAEVFAERVHQELYPLKIGGDRWVELMEAAHQAGLKSNCTMLYGHIERAEEKVDHLIRLRELQDRTGGFLAFIPLAFHPDNSDMADLPGTTGFSDLKQIAIARLMLDNIPHIKAYWIMITPQISQVALWYGADDIDGTVIEEKIYHDAGAQTPQSLTRNALAHLIREAGREPLERDNVYNLINRDYPMSE
ncbi:MAG: aminofutalosine synthase MqnE [Acidobacteria bacterium]|nr:aminofutalosine synthase MqnE [Acidobacteriota bacterium]MBI3658523.1 aminofutalosine synthase MqnE [Acidobacteriota bacterium]